MSATIYASGPEEWVNYRPLAQTNATSTALAGGGWIVTWVSNNDQDGSGYGIYQQLFGADGKKIGPEKLVNTTTAGDQEEPRVTALADGGWVIVWETPNPYGGVSSYQQRYSNTGQAWGGETLIGTSSTGSNSRYTTNVTGLDNGGWVVTWQEGSTLYQTHYAKDGNPTISKSPVATSVQIRASSKESASSVTFTEGGGWVVTWVGNGGIQQQRYNSDGRANGATIKVNATEAGAQQDLKSADVTTLQDGGWVVTWQLKLDGDAGYVIYQQRYSKSGARIGGEVKLSQFTKEQSHLSVTALADGGWVTTWDGPNAAGTQAVIYQQYFAKDGAASAVQQLEIKNFADYGGHPSVVALADGSWMLAWDAYDDNETTWNVHYQRFMPNKAPSDISLSHAGVLENAGNGTAIGTVSGQDANVGYGDALTYTLIDNAGGRFYLDGTTLRVANGALLDYEAATSHTIVVRVSDRDQSYIDRVFTIQVGDVVQETLIGTNSANVLYGTGGHEWIYGYGGNDTLSGGAGDDRLFGGTGKDRLTGGAGKDVFVFNSNPNKKTNFDKITDFNVKDDSIWLDNSVFKALGKKGTETKPAQLKKSFFKTFDKAHPLNQDANDYVLYNKSTGALYYDADGAGGKASVQIATLSKKLKLTYKDFFVI